MSSPLISLVTVVFNGEALIADTLRSAVQQTYSNIELVIVDGASHDQTLKAVEPFRAHIGTLISEPDKGIYDAMNKGIRAAKGEWIYFLNAGDAFFDNNVLSDLFEGTDLEGVSLLYGKVQTRNEPSGINYITGEPVSINDFYIRYPICHQATFTRKSAFTEIGAYNIAYRLAADTEWFARFFARVPGQARFADRIIAFYDIQGATYQKRMQGYREYLRFGRELFPASVSLRNHLLYPVIWAKVKLIRALQHTSFFQAYRKMKFGRKVAG